MSYVTEAEMTTYMATKFQHVAYDAANTDQRTRAMAEATRIIDQLNFAGEKYDEDQANEFPRGDDTTVPTPIKEATYEIAYALLDGYDPELEQEALGQVQAFFEQVRSKRDPTHVPEHVANGVPTATAWRLLKPFLRDPHNIRLFRVT